MNQKFDPGSGVLIYVLIDDEVYVLLFENNKSSGLFLQEPGGKKRGEDTNITNAQKEFIEETCCSMNVEELFEEFAVNIDGNYVCIPIVIESTMEEMTQLEKQFTSNHSKLIELSKTLPPKTIKSYVGTVEFKLISLKLLLEGIKTLTKPQHLEIQIEKPYRVHIRTVASIYLVEQSQNFSKLPRYKFQKIPLKTDKQYINILNDEICYNIIRK